MLILIFGFVFQACEKEKILKSPIEIGERVEPTSLIFDMKDDVNLEKTELEKTVLGGEIDNPFLLIKMQEAENSIYGNEAKNLAATDLYVEFYPSGPEDIKLLDELDIDYFDFPLGQEIIKTGDSYQDLADDEFPVLYAVMPVNFTFPSGISYTVNDALYLDQSDKMTLAESFRLTGFLDEIEAVDVRAKDISPDIIGSAKIPPIIDCPPGYEPKLIPIVPAPPSGFHQYEWECVPIIPNDDPPSVNCVSGHERTPGGRITVQDTELSTPGDFSTFEPVRQVRVIMFNKFGWPFFSRTNDDGCWKVNWRFHGRGRMMVRFKNNKCRIRATHRKNISVLWKWIVTHDAWIGRINGPTFNNINVNFHMWEARGNNTHLNWGAATINNAVHEFHDYAIADGIATPEKLDIYATRNRRDGYALMHSQDVIAQPIAELTSSALALIPFLAPFKPLINLGLRGAILAYLPEVSIGIDFQHSDRLKSLAYHEIAHASHYGNVNTNYWNKLVRAEIIALGHGNENSWQAGVIAVCESWADHIGKTFAHTTYGASVSFSTFNSFSEWLESQRNEEFNHIPTGYYNDLADGVNTSEFVGDGFWANQNTGTLSDNVSGFTNSQMFSVLTPLVNSPDEFTNWLIAIHLNSTSNTEEQVRNLFNSY